MELLQAVLTSQAPLERNGRLRMSEQARFCETELFFKQHVKLCSLAENGAVISLTNASLQESGAKILMAF